MPTETPIPTTSRDGSDTFEGAVQLKHRGADPTMPRFFFNLTNHKKVHDDRGELCTLAEARDTALQVAAELGRNQHRNKIRGLSISVTDANGTELFRTPLRSNL